MQIKGPGKDYTNKQALLMYYPVLWIRIRTGIGSTRVIKKYKINSRERYRYTISDINSPFRDWTDLKILPVPLFSWKQIYFKENHFFIKLFNIYIDNLTLDPDQNLAKILDPGIKFNFFRSTTLELTQEVLKQ